MSGPAPLLHRIGRLRDRVARLVELRSEDDPTAHDPLRGLYLSEEAVRYLLRRAGADQSSAGPDSGAHPAGEARPAGEVPPHGGGHPNGGAHAHGGGHPNGGAHAHGGAHANGGAQPVGAVPPGSGPHPAGEAEPHGDPHTHRGAHPDGGEHPVGEAHPYGGVLPPAAVPPDSGVLPAGEASPAGGAHSDGDRLHRLALRLGLTELDVRILLIALAPDLDRTFESLYGYLNDDVSRRRATIGLALELCGLRGHSAEGRARFHASAPLRALGLLRVEEDDRPLLGRSLRVPDRVAAHLLGDDTQDPVLDGRVRRLPAPLAHPESDPLVRRLAKRLVAGPLTVHLRERREGDGLACAAAALALAGLDALHLAPTGRDDDEELVPALLREARLRGRAVVVQPLPDEPGPLVRALAVSDVPVLLAGTGPYDPQWCDGRRDPLVLDAPRQRAGDLDAWSAALGTAGGPGLDLAAVAAPYRLGADRVRRAAAAARELAAFEDAPLTATHLGLAARQQSASGLERHARRIRPAVDWDDLVLPEGPLAQLRELALRARYRDRVLGDWRLSAGGGRGRGVLALFAGDSGTGKTLSAEVVAAELGLDLYVVQLSSVVDKYIGETEKNLERIFAEADRTDCVLLFDEADAVFGKRSEVKDAHDRYANLESAYLLQRLESFDGIALLTTNLRANIDEAFTRRLDLVVDFPFPDPVQRLALWRHSLASVPCVPGIDPEPCAREFELAGGSIRSAVVTAAYAAAGRGEPVTGADLLAGARREYRKAGRLVLEDGGW